MGISKRVLISNRKLSFLSRCFTVLLIFTAGLITAAVSLQYFYQQAVNDYFADGIATEDNLIIQIDRHTLTATGNKKDHFLPLLDDELGAYQSHRFIGWNADVERMKSSESLPFILLYEVRYEKRITEESFYYRGVTIPKLHLRKVMISTASLD
ncbi:hypothetical protein GZ77_11515 [Endozoicomonas montiporae]|uniref:Uncharacterized protein n=2 Tax=Endozoicomonas montiporae TaxID=1027273 RepID=A0A081N8W1_9GAMM|nr:hypothetical protein [Endozoicomonas montiporae]AMO55196.1 hypothetical protein EZMO1_0982 [Endozoicomonas montiporae CL-33]KEQ14884.1 hypothetical protein GZ77_11515 [Endozoicomonas montiporae]